MSNELNKEFSFSNQPSNQQAQTNETPTSSEFDTVRLQYALKKSWVGIAVIITVMMIAAFLYNRYTKPLFRASAIIQLEFNEDAQIIGLTAGGGRGQQAKSLSGEIEIIKSNVVYEEVLKDINLDVSYFFNGQILNDEKFASEIPFSILYSKENNPLIVGQAIYVTPQKNNTALISIENGAKRTAVESPYRTPVTVNGFTFSIIDNKHTTESINQPYFFTINNQTSLLHYLNQNLTVKILNFEANTLGVYFTDYNANKAKAITQSVINIYLKKSIEQKQKSNAQTLLYINNQLDSTLQKLKHIEDQMQALSEGSMFGNTSEAYQIITTQIDKYTIEKTELDETLKLLDHLNQLVSNNKEVQSFLPQLEGLGSSNLSSSIARLNEINQDFQKLKESNTSSTLSYKNKEIERNAIRNTILVNIFENKKILLEHLQDLSDKLAELSSELKKLPSKETGLVGLKRYYGLYEKFFLLLNQKKVEFETAKAGKVPDFLILSNPSVNPTPVTAQPLIIYTGFGVGSLFLAFLLIVIIFFLQDKILNEKELSKICALPIIGSIPKFKKEKMKHSKLQVIDFPQSRVSEAFRNIRSNLEFICPNKTARIITISSTISGEGKTFITLNLAGILALTGKKVIVLDLDLRKPKLHHGFDTTNDLGTSDLLIEKTTLKECIKHSEFEGLDFITAGNKPPNPSELILTDRFENLLDELKMLYDVIIIDTPPIGLVTDGILAMKKADIQLYIARAGHTKISMLKDVELIKRNKQFKNLSIILNDVSASGRSYGYSGYGYGYYDEEKTTTKA